MSEASQQPTPLPAKKANAETKAWHQHQLELQQKAPERIEEAAKFLSGMISISLTIFLSVDKKSFEGMEDSSVMKLAVLFWILSLLFAFLVFFPKRYAYNQASAESIKNMNKRVVRNKYLLLIAATVLFFLALAMLVGVFLA